MQIKKAEFVISSPNYTKCPEPDKPEYAFIGRSNVGKSSLINMITNNGTLAKTSSKPGKTQLINHFLIDNSWYLVDLPGIGFAKISKEIKEKWEKMIKDYLLKRENLMCIFFLVDSRLTPQKVDLQFIEWLGEKQIPFVLVFTKIDKIGVNQLNSNVNEFKNELLKSWDQLPDTYYSSTIQNKGKSEILNFVKETNKLFNNQID